MSDRRLVFTWGKPPSDKFVYVRRALSQGLFPSSRLDFCKEFRWLYWESRETKHFTDAGWALDQVKNEKISGSLRPYESPVVRVYGDLGALTHAVSMAGVGDGGKGNDKS